MESNQAMSQMVDNITDDNQGDVKPDMGSEDFTSDDPAVAAAHGTDTDTAEEPRFSDIAKQTQSNDGTPITPDTQQHWLLTPKVLELMRARNTALDILMHDKTPENQAAYRILRNRVSSAIKLGRKRAMSIEQKKKQKKKNQKLKRQQKRNAEAVTNPDVMQKKRRSMQPNHFVAIEIDSEEIRSKLRQVQDTILEKDARYKLAMVCMEKLHLTLMVFRTETDEEVERAKQALNNVAARLAATKGFANSLQVQGLGQFKNRIVSCSVKPESMVKTVRDAGEECLKCFMDAGIPPIDVKPVKPHLTIMKYSKNHVQLKEQGVLSFETSYFDEFKEMFFGEQMIKSIQICMMQSETYDSYYNVIHQAGLIPGDTCGFGAPDYKAFPPNYSRTYAIPAQPKPTPKREDEGRMNMDRMAASLERLVRSNSAENLPYYHWAVALAKDLNHIQGEKLLLETQIKIMALVSEARITDLETRVQKDGRLENGEKGDA